MCLLARVRAQAGRINADKMTNELVISSVLIRQPPLRGDMRAGMMHWYLFVCVSVISGKNLRFPPCLPAGVPGQAGLRELRGKFRTSWAQIA